MYLYSEDDDEVCDWIERECRSRFTGWKSKINRARNARIAFKKTSQITAPFEFRRRLKEWDFLCQHFDSIEFKVSNNVPKSICIYIFLIIQLISMFFCKNDRP